MAFRTLDIDSVDANQRRAYFDVRLPDRSPALGESGQQPEILVNAGSWNTTGISTLGSVGFGRYFADLQSNIIGYVGDIIQTRYRGSATVETAGDTFQIVSVNSSNVTPNLGAISLVSYVEVSEADIYFSTRLNSELWQDSSRDDKAKSLRQATRIIDRLNFAGCKHYSGQILEFPRDKDASVPSNIQVACCEIAFALLDGLDPDLEIENINSISQGYSNIKTMYDRSFVLPHVRAGVPSATAWSFLRPYLRDPRNVSIVRTS